MVILGPLLRRLAGMMRPVSKPLRYRTKKCDDEPGAVTRRVMCSRRSCRASLSPVALSACTYSANREKEDIGANEQKEVFGRASRSCLRPIWLHHRRRADGTGII